MFAFLHLLCDAATVLLLVSLYKGAADVQSCLQSVVHCDGERPVLCVTEKDLITKLFLN